jgi:hypothetical protein
MKLALPPFTKYYASYTFYFIYALMWSQTWRIMPQLKHDLDGGLIPLFGVFTAIAFIIISILKAIFRSKDQRKFYLWLILFIILPPVAFILMNS